MIKNRFLSLSKDMSDFETDNEDEDISPRMPIAATDSPIKAVVAIAAIPEEGNEDASPTPNISAQNATGLENGQGVLMNGEEQAVNGGAD